MVRVTYVDGNGHDAATVELDDFTVKTLHPRLAEMLAPRRVHGAGTPAALQALEEGSTPSLPHAQSNQRLNRLGSADAVSASRGHPRGRSWR